MPSAKDIYLAQHYLSGPKADFILSSGLTSGLTSSGHERRLKKKVKKSVSTSASTSASAGLKISDDSDSLQTQESGPAEEDDGGDPLVVQQDRSDSEAAVKKLKFKSGVFSSGGAIAPSIAPSTASAPSGLTTAAELRALRETEESLPIQTPADGAEQETIYRDSSGRILDLDLERQAVERRSLAEAAESRKRAEWGKGLTQRQAEKDRQAELDLVRTGARSGTVYADDAALNSELRAVRRWDDPAAAFLKSAPSASASASTLEGQAPKYTGPTPPPNRFGIPPGFRWDGVDRSNGFEAKAQAAANSRRAKSEVEYRWRSSEM